MKHTKPTKEAIAAARKVPNLSQLESLLVAEAIQESWDLDEKLFTENRLNKSIIVCSQNLENYQED